MAENTSWGRWCVLMEEAPGGEPSWAADTLFCWPLLPVMELCLQFRAGVTATRAGQAPDTQNHCPAA